MPGDNPVGISVVVHAYADGRIRVNVLIGAGIKRRQVVIIAESVDVLIIVRLVFVPLAHRGIEIVLCNYDPLTQDRGLESQRYKVALHLLNVVLAEKLQVLNAEAAAPYMSWITTVISNMIITEILSSVSVLLVEEPELL